MHNILPAGLYGITDPALLPGDALFSGVEQALRGGCRIIQYRDKLASPAEQLSKALRLKSLCAQYQAVFIINDSLELALAADADGLHLGKSDGQLAQARSALGTKKIIGVTCHSDLEYAQNCIDAGADYCAFGRFFSSQTKPDAPACELATLKQAVKLSVPVVAIGGIDVDKLARFSDTPPHNIAVIHSLFSSPNIEQAATDLSTAFSKIYPNPNATI